ncbi:MAG: hypothetical protein DI538_22250 [Azospira oryzae]|nr:MAG: hypothetical protein DI538_22250 [Azospira oryzae]
MIKTFFTPRTIDIIGCWTSILCAMHCLLVPMLLSAGLFSKSSFLEHAYVEEAVIVLSAILAFRSLLPGYFRHHRKFAALGFCIAGFVIITLSRMADTAFWEIALTTSGAMLVATAHMINHQTCKQADVRRTIQQQQIRSRDTPV